MEPHQLFAIDDVHGVYADAFVTDNSGQLLFGSFWGRDTAIQGLLARLSLPVSEGGLYRLQLVESEEGLKRTLEIGHVDRLQKLSGRMPKANLFGDVVQLWLYDRRAIEPDYATRRALRLIRSTDEQVDPHKVAVDCPMTWEMIRQVCHLPLLDHWQECFVRVVLDHGWLAFHTGVGTHALTIDLSSDELEPVVQSLIHEGQLGLSEVDEATEANVPAASVGPETLRPAVISTDDAPSRLTPDQLANELACFAGTTTWYRHWLVKTMTYTDGVQCFAEQGGQQGAYWFIDVVAKEFYPLLRSTRSWSSPWR